MSSPTNNLDNNLNYTTIQSTYYELGKRGSSKHGGAKTSGWRMIPYIITHYFPELAKSPIPLDAPVYAQYMAPIFYKGFGVVATVTSYLFKEMAEHARDIDINQPFCMTQAAKIALLKSPFGTEEAFNALPTFDCLTRKIISAWHTYDFNYPVIRGVDEEHNFHIILSKSANEVMTISIVRGQVVMFMHQQEERVKLMTNGILSPKKK